MIQPSTIVVVDRHELYREALAALIREAWPNAEVTLLDRPEDCAPCHADIVLIDIDALPGGETVDLTAVVRTWGGARVIALADRAITQQIVRALHAGMRGVLPRTMSREGIRDAVALVLQGCACFPAEALRDIADASLSAAPLRCRRELDVLQQLDRGCSNKVIARELGVSVATVKAHVQSILRATQAKNRTEAVANARRLGMLPTH